MAPLDRFTPPVRWGDGPSDRPSGAITGWAGGQGRFLRADIRLKGSSANPHRAADAVARQAPFPDQAVHPGYIEFQNLSHLGNRQAFQMLHGLHPLFAASGRLSAHLDIDALQRVQMELPTSPPYPGDGHALSSATANYRIGVLGHPRGRKGGWSAASGVRMRGSYHSRLVQDWRDVEVSLWERGLYIYAGHLWLGEVSRSVRAVRMAIPAHCRQASGRGGGVPQSSRTSELVLSSSPLVQLTL